MGLEPKPQQHGQVGRQHVCRLGVCKDFYPSGKGKGEEGRKTSARAYLSSRQPGGRRRRQASSGIAAESTQERPPHGVAEAVRTKRFEQHTVCLLGDWPKHLFTYEVPDPPSVQVGLGRGKDVFRLPLFAGEGMGGGLTVSTLHITEGRLAECFHEVRGRFME